MPRDPRAKDEKAPLLLVYCSEEFLIGAERIRGKIEMGARKPRSTWHQRPYQADKWTHQLPEVVINKKTSQQYEQEGGKGRAGLI